MAKDPMQKTGMLELAAISIGTAGGLVATVIQGAVAATVLSVVVLPVLAYEQAEKAYHDIRDRRRYAQNQ